jgi:hypothetical protein
MPQCTPTHYNNKGKKKEMLLLQKKKKERKKKETSFSLARKYKSKALAMASLKEPSLNPSQVNRAP